MGGNLWHPEGVALVFSGVYESVLAPRDPKVTKMAGLMVLWSHLAHRCQRKWGKEGRAVMGHPQEGSQRSAFVTSEKQAEVEKREREKKHLCLAPHG